MSAAEVPVVRAHLDGTSSETNGACVAEEGMSCRHSAQRLCDTRSHCMSVAEESLPSGACLRLSPIPTCVAGNGGVRSAG